MRALYWMTLSALLTSAAPALAEGTHLRAGGDLELFFRGEAYGEGTPLPAVAPRLALQLPWNLGLEAGYRFAYSSDGEALAVSTQLHGFKLLATYALPLPTSRLHAGLGPSLNLLHTSISDHGTPIRATTYSRAGIRGALGIDIRLGSADLRLGTDVNWASRRWDIAFGVGGSLLLF